MVLAIRSAEYTHQGSFDWLEIVKKNNSIHWTEDSNVSPHQRQEIRTKLQKTTHHKDVIVVENIKAKAEEVTCLDLNGRLHRH